MIADILENFLNRVYQVMRSAIFFSELKIYFKSYSPLFATFLPWTFVLVGSLFPLCKIIQSDISLMHLLVLGNMLSLCFLILFRHVFSRGDKVEFKSPIESLCLTSRFKRLIFRMLFFFLLIECFQMVYFGGVPLFWVLTRDSRSYVDYGFQSLNGLLNAVYLLATTGLAFSVFVEYKKRYLFFLILLILFPILLVSRQVLMCLFLQISCCYMFVYPDKKWKVLKYFIAVLAVFVLIGNIRTGLSSLVSILEPYGYVPQMLYPLLWIYAYVLTPFNNISASIDVITPVGAPYLELSSLVPSTLKSWFSVSVANTGFKLVHKNMTVSTFYYQPLLDFGPVYAFGFMMFFQVLFLKSFWRLMKAPSAVYLIEYSVYYMIMILSIFSNLFLFLPVIFQLIMIQVLKFQFVRKADQVILRHRKGTI